MKPPVLGKHLATFNLFREPDNSLQVTVADASGVRLELGDSGAPLHLCAMNALRQALQPKAAPNLSTDPVAIAAYDEGGSWGRLSEGWPETPYTLGKLLLCTKAEVVPYGQYVVVHAEGKYPSYEGAVIRVATEALKAKLEKAYEGMFVECRRFISAQLAGKVNVE